MASKEKTSKPQFPADFALSETYRHFDVLIWQVPSVAITIALGTIVAADQLKCVSCWALSCAQLRGVVLLLGFILVSALSVALFKYRVFQIATVDQKKATKPPFGIKPSAGVYLQLAVCLSAGILLGLAFYQIVESVCLVAISGVGVVVLFIYFELRQRSLKEYFRKLGEDGSDDSSSDAQTA